MIDGLFDVVFRGQIVKSFDQATVEANLVQLFKSTPDAVSRLFSGKEVVIRKNLDYSAAMKYQSALKNAGALALIKEVEQQASQKIEPSAKAEPTAQAVPSAQASQAEPSAQADHSAQMKPSAQAVKAEQNSEQGQPQKAAAETSDDHLSIAEPGVQILPEKVYQQRDVDTSGLSLASVGERILPNKPPEQHQEPKTDHLSLED